MGNYLFKIDGNNVKERTALGQQLPYPKIPLQSKEREAKHFFERPVPSYRYENEKGVYIAGYSTVHANGLYDRNVKRWQTFTGYETKPSRQVYLNEDMDTETYARIKKPSVAPMHRQVFGRPN